MNSEIKFRKRRVRRIDCTTSVSVNYGLTGDPNTVSLILLGEDLRQSHELCPDEAARLGYRLLNYARIAAPSLDSDELHEVLLRLKQWAKTKYVPGAA